MTRVRSKSIPLPAAVLALSVAVCLGAAVPAQATGSHAGRAVQAEQRETIEHLLDAIHQAARKLADRLAGQSADVARREIRPVLSLAASPQPTPRDDRPRVLFLREALLSLPPPVC